MIRRVRTLAVAAVAAAVLAGCTQVPGTAAVVNGQRITERDVTDAGQTIKAVFGEAQPASVAVDLLVNEPIFTRVSAAHGIEISDDAVKQFFIDYAAQNTGQEVTQADFTPAGIDVARLLWLSSQLSGQADADQIGQELTQARQDAEIEVNPRYGEYDEAGQLVPVQLPWIAAAPAAG